MRQLKLFSTSLYYFDTSAFIDLTYHYPKDIFPTIWSKLENMIQNQELFSHIEVLNEINNGERDEVHNWCNKHKKIFKDIDGDQLKNLEKIKSKYPENIWARESSKPHWADPWLVSLAICDECTIIVTNEVDKNFRIPFVARLFNIACLGLHDFFRNIRILY